MLKIPLYDHADAEAYKLKNDHCLWSVERNKTE